MSPDELHTLVRNAVATTLGHDPATINEDERLMDLGADSLDLVDIELKIGDELLSSKLDDSQWQIEHTDTVASIVAALSQVEGVLG